ncbi:tRNA lysidine(34) synthetase TilS [Pseudooceanicola sp. 200-1SW]|uniref:tRNA lysidine(34) synthetase TilS n=1 Tax=Pseudooceanicola sp. 200-1SW TaxID=3425949 RepID=UPI003D7FC71E
MTETTSLLKEIVAGHFLPGPAEEIGLAVSGGGDSMALMHVMAEIAAEGGLRLRVATVDHGLRPEAAEEAAFVGRVAAGLGLPHEVLHWVGGAREEGNLQDRARRARYDLLGDWARRHGLRQVALGHTADDQAETFLMRLARAPGADGLSGMAVRRRLGPVTLVRPLLETSRNCLRIYMEQRGLPWIEDPSNEDDRFDRVRARRALELLRPLGLTSQALAETAKNMASVRAALGWYAFAESQRLVRIQGGDLVIERSGFRVLQPEIARRLLAQGLMWISGSAYPPRRRALALALESVRSGTGMTLHGCQISVGLRELRIAREFAAVKELSSPADGVWDGRWRLSGPWDARFGATGAEIRPLGAEGLRLCGEWRAAGLPYRSLLGYPAVWAGDELVAAPHAGFGQGWRADLLRGEDAFHAGLLAQ